VSYDGYSLVTVASIIASFGVAMLVFRLQRELEMKAKGEINWIPYADGLYILAALSALLLVILPILFGTKSRIALCIARAATCLSVFFLAGYIPSILAHYRLILGGGRTGPRTNPESAERVCVWVIVGVALIGAIGTLLA
jgi:hypothetical protein